MLTRRGLLGAAGIVGAEMARQYGMPFCFKELPADSTPRNKRVFSRLSEEGFPESVEWEDIRGGDLIMAVDWDEQGRMCGMYGWDVREVIEREDSRGGIALVCNGDFSISMFWFEALRRQGRL